jgi:hypothetical protein
MSIDIEKFESWIDSRSTEIGVVKKCGGGKYLLNSVFVKGDEKFHLGLFPLRGEYGRYNDYKSENRGTVVDFVSFVDGVSKAEASKRVLSDKSIKYEKVDEKPVIKTDKVQVELPRGCIGFDEECEHPMFSASKDYIKDRGLWDYKSYFRFCKQDCYVKDGKCQYIAGRVLIPFYDVDGYLEYWTARTLVKNLNPKYIEVANGTGCVTKAETLYAPCLKNVLNTSALIVEGPIDCMSVTLCDIPCVSIQGSQLYDKQIEKINAFGIEPIFAFDRDKAGMKAMIRAHSIYPKSRFVLAPEGMDWNGALVGMGQCGLRKHILNNVATFAQYEIELKRMKFYLS